MKEISLVLLEKTSVTQQYFLYIHVDALEAFVPTDTALLCFQVLDEHLHASWGHKSILNPNYRFMEFNMQSVREAKKLASDVYLCLFGFVTPKTKYYEPDPGFISF